MEMEMTGVQVWLRRDPKAGELPTGARPAYFFVVSASIHGPLGCEDSTCLTKLSCGGKMLIVGSCLPHSKVTQRIHVRYSILPPTTSIYNYFGLLPTELVP